MNVIEIDGREMTSRAAAHAHLQCRLSLPAYYGNNLDALYDCLCDIGEPTRIVLRYRQRMTLSLEGYGARLLRVLRRAQEDNECLSVSLEGEGPEAL